MSLLAIIKIMKKYRKSKNEEKGESKSYEKGEKEPSQRKYRKSKRVGASKNPFGKKLVSHEGTRFQPMKNQGKFDSGKTLLAKAMKRMAKKK